MVPPLKKISDYVWEIPKGYKPCMKVPARIFADETLLEKMKTDMTLEQAANVACLPGIYKYSIALPDAHQGYGFPVGGVAAMDMEQGVVSPGGIGYDINCLPPGTKVLTRFGYVVPIESLIKGGELISIDRSTKVPKPTKIKLFLWRRENKLMVIRTESGYLLKASSDHPVLTPRGMVNAGELRVGDRVALYPFEGVPYEEPPNKVILSGNEFPEVIARELSKRGLLPLTTRNPKLPILLKLLGYFIGDGSFNGVRGKITAFYGSREGLEEMRRDIEELGYKANIYCRVRRVRINGKETEGHECALHVSSRSFKALLIALGAPPGKKTHIPFRVPSWVMELPLWMKRLFLAGYFGAEMSKPITINGYNFEQPHVTISKVRELERSGYDFLNDIAKMLREFGIETNSIQKIYPSNDRVWLRLYISSTPENLIRLWGRIGYEYNPERRRLANAAIVWLRLKEKIINLRSEARQLAIAMARSGYAKSDIVTLLVSEYVNERFIERSIYEDGVDRPRVPKNFPTFEDWYRDRVDGDIVWDVVEEVREEPFDGLVYDLTIDDESHDFIAEGFVVSNCGVRLLRTNLTEKDVRPKLRELVDTIFKLVPAGVGETGLLRLSFGDLDKVLDEGVDWALSKGYGWGDDKDFIEEFGHYEGADSSKVSQRAKERGKDELGTTGSGNHFIEIQVVNKIFDADLAKRLGIEQEGQVMVLIHTGSRGLGHQVATDYIRVAENKMKQWGLFLPDRELAAMPLTTKEAQDYLAAMKAAANYAWTNRQIITHWVREAFRRVFGKDPDKLGLEIVYDVAHNIAKIEDHVIDDEGHVRRVLVHRKGATRSFPAGRPEIPPKYRDIGQPVLIPGSMGTASYVLIGLPTSFQVTFGTAPHGAGRTLSRSAAVRMLPPNKVRSALESRGIIVRSAESEIISEEAPEAYKNVDKVAEVAELTGMAKRVSRHVPIGVVKG
ncbi:intein-containing RctB family protein [Vulcanisaeta sp. JCM 16161]|uniref:intein-containing RctB family protein n=1 Tax=Vulcanisaeta sp. JCM 16161 TaxID=1295372 RepID=UPI00406CA954